MKALVTGADGLLGSHIVRRLLARGAQVRAFLLESSDSPALRGLELETVRGDILGGAAKLAEAMRGCETVYHAAALTDRSAPPGLVWKVNLEGARRTMDAAAAAGVRRFVLTGSASSFQFGSKERPGDETGAFPEAYRRVPYVESKRAAHDLARDYAATGRLDAVIVSPTFMLGEYDWRPSSGELIRQFLKRGLRFSAPGGRCFAYAGDVAEAHVRAAEKGGTGECYIAGGVNLTYMEFFTLVAGMAGAKPPALTLPAPLVLAAGAAGSLVGRATGRRGALDLELARLSCSYAFYSSRKAERELGYSITPVEAAARRSLESLRAYGHIA